MASAVQHPCKVKIDLAVFFIQKIIEPLFSPIRLQVEYLPCHSVRIEAEYTMTVFTINLLSVLT